MSSASLSRQIFTTLLVAGALAVGPGAAAAPSGQSVSAAGAATAVNLGSAEAYSALGSAVTSSGSTALVKDLGVSPAGAIVGFPPGTAAAIHNGDASADQAQVARAAAYSAAAAQPGGTAFAGDQIGVTFHPGVHTSAAAFANTGTMTLDADGDSSAVFVFQIGAAYSPAASSHVVLAGGALANNVFWQVNGAVSFGAGATSVGTYLASGAVTLGAGAAIKGRVLTPGAITLSNNALTEPKDDLTAPIVTIAGGPARSTSDTTPTISGTTDEPIGRPVTVTVSGQTLTTTVGIAGAWGVSATALTQGVHNVVASVTDASQNTGTATQALTVDITAPSVSIDGGEAKATKDTTPTISGVTNAVAGTPVSVTVGGQTLTTTVTGNGSWSVLAAALTEAAHNVVATVDDASANTGTATQILIVDVTMPVVTIDGGAARSTNDTSPWMSGTTGEPAGTTVHVAVADQHLTTLVGPGGVWSVSATTLSAGPHRAGAWITDAAQNTGAVLQTLTITGAGPVVPAARYRPDAAIRRMNGRFVGTGTYVTADQKVTQQMRRRPSVMFEVSLTNRGDRADRMSVRGTPRSSSFRVTYRADGHNVTRAVVAGTYRTANLLPGETTRLVMKVTRTAGARTGNGRAFQVQATSTHEPTKSDTVTAGVRL